MNKLLLGIVIVVMVILFISGLRVMLRDESLNTIIMGVLGLAVSIWIITRFFIGRLVKQPGPVVDPLVSARIRLLRKWLILGTTIGSIIPIVLRASPEGGFGVFPLFFIALPLQGIVLPIALSWATTELFLRQATTIDQVQKKFLWLVIIGIVYVLYVTLVFFPQILF